jgi:hypothetical protein
LPILQQATDKPSFLVTSSFLWEDPIPMLFSLSMVKASQRNLVQSLQKMNSGVHIALLNVAGPVSPEDPYILLVGYAVVHSERYCGKTLVLYLLQSSLILML